VCTPVITPVTVGWVGTAADAAPAVANETPIDAIVIPAALIPLRMRIVPSSSVASPNPQLSGFDSRLT